MRFLIQSLVIIHLMFFPEFIFGNDPSQSVQNLEKAQLLFDSKKYDSALNFAQNALKTFQKEPKSENLGNCLNLIGRIYLRKRDYQSAFEYFQNALSVRQKILGDEHPDVANCWNNLGICYRRFRDFEKAIGAYEKALFIRTKNNLAADIAVSHNNLGNLYLQLEKTDEAIKNFQKALDFRILHFGENHLNVAKSQITLAGVLFDNGAVFQAKNLYQKALKIRIQKRSENDLSLATIYDDLGLIFQYRNELDSAQIYHENALKIMLQSVGESSVETGRIYNNLGNCHFQKKDFDSALKYYEYARRVFENLLEKNDPVLADCLNNFGSCYFEKGDYDEALNYFNQALDIAETTDFDPQKQAVYKTNIGQIHSLTDNWETAYLHYGGAIDLLKKLPGSSLYLPSVLTAIGELFLKQNAPPDQNDLELALEKFSEALSLLNQHWESYQNPQSVQILLDNNYKVFEFLTETHFRLWEVSGEKIHLENAFEIIEKSKGMVRNELFQKRFLKGKFSVSESYIPKISDLQNQLLTDDRALLNWFFADSVFYIFAITKNHFVCVRENLNFPIREWISGMRSGIYHFPIAGGKAAGKHNEDYIKYGQLLYQKLLKTTVEKLPESVTKLTLLPDGLLNYLPFDALLTEAPKADFAFKNFPYLIKKYQISYGFSAAHLVQLSQSENPKKSKKYLGIAPSFENDKRGLSPLRFNKKEVENVRNILGGDILMNEEATTENFLKKAPNFGILHLATHGNADSNKGELSYLAFAENADSNSPDFLTVNDFRNLRLNADLAVLSACETGIGEFRRGEGVVSLASGIAHSGARSVVTTLWAVSDIASAKLVESFFGNLKEDMPKDEALRQAKLDYIAENPNDKAHPFYWAGFIAVGETDSLSFGVHFGWYLVGGLALIFVFYTFLSFFKIT